MEGPGRGGRVLATVCVYGWQGVGAGRLKSEYLRRCLLVFGTPHKGTQTPGWGVATQGSSAPPPASSELEDQERCQETLLKLSPLQLTFRNNPSVYQIFSETRSPGLWPQESGGRPLRIEGQLPLV